MIILHYSCCCNCVFFFFFVFLLEKSVCACMSVCVRACICVCERKLEREWGNVQTCVVVNRFCFRFYSQMQKVMHGNKMHTKRKWIIFLTFNA